MSENLCPSTILGTEDLDPDVVTRMIIIGPKASVGSQEIVNEFHSLNLPITTKATCYGAMVSGKEKDVLYAMEKIRDLDPNNIFTKDRGFAPGDPRRCRGHRFGPREGFHQLEKEFRLLGYISDALTNPEEVNIEVEKPIDVDEFKDIMNDFLKEKNLKD